MTVTVCVGSSCFVRGAPQVIEEFERLIESLPPGSVELKGSFCMEKCTHGVTVRIGDKTFSAVKPEAVKDLFEQEVLPGVRSCL